jgi:hypothetical protein
MALKKKEESCNTNIMTPLWAAMGRKINEM